MSTDGRDHEPLDGTSHVPLGEGLVVRRLRMKPEDVVRLRGILAGYDGLASRTETAAA